MSNNKHTWYIGKFYTDMSNSVISFGAHETIIYIPYYIEDGKCFTITDKTGNEVLEVPIRKSNEYPYSTGLLVTDEKPETTFKNVKSMMGNTNDLAERIETINRVRNPKSCIPLADSKKYHDGWMPKCMSHLAGYTWKKVPFVRPPKNGSSEYKQKMVPVLFLDGKKYIYIDKWELVEALPSTITVSRGRCKEEEKTVDLGFIFDESSYIDCHSNFTEAVCNWYQNNMEWLREDISLIKYLESNNLSLESYDQLNREKAHFDQLMRQDKDPEYIIKCIRSVVGLDDSARKILHDYLYQEFGDRLYLNNPNLTEKQLYAMTEIPSISRKDAAKGIEKIITIGDWTFLKKYSEGLKQTIIESSLPSTHEHGYVEYGEKLYDLCVDSLGFEIIPGGIQNLNDIHGDIGWAATRALMGLVIGKCERNAGIEKLSSVLLDKNLFDIARGLIKQEEDKKAGKTPQDVTINCVIIDDNIEGKSPIHFGKITIPPGINILGLRIDPRLNFSEKPLFDVSKVTYQELPHEKPLITDFIPSNYYSSGNGGIDKNKLNALKKTGYRAS